MEKKKWEMRDAPEKKTFHEFEISAVEFPVSATDECPQNTIKKFAHRFGFPRRCRQQ